MIINVYIKKHSFKLPRDQEDLTEQIKKRFYRKKTLSKSAITKTYNISKIEENIDYKKDINIFLLNLYLLILEKNHIKNFKDIPIKLSNEKIIEELSQILNQNLNGLSVEDIEEIVLIYLNTSTEKENNENKDVSSYEENLNINEVEFTIDWVKKIDKKIRE